MEKIIKTLKKFSLKQRVFFNLLLFFTLYLVSFLSNHFSKNYLADFFQVSLGLFFMLFGFGISIVLLLQWLLKRNFNFWEFVSLDLAGGLIVFPLFLLLEFAIFKKVYDWYPIFNITLSLLISSFILFLNKNSLPKINISNTKKFLMNPLFVIFVFGFVFTLFQVLIYPTLPDLDPYKWMFKYTYQFSGQLLDLAERPMFGAFVFMSTRTMGVSILQFFKYILPFFYLLSLLPAWMIAKNFSKNKHRWIFLLFVFTSPVGILYAQTAMPQMALIIIAYFFVFFLIYAHEKASIFFFYMAGFVAALSSLYHQAGVILFGSWLIVALISKRSLIFRDKKNLFFIIFLIATNLQRIKPLYSFATNWIDIIIARIFSPNNFNFLYPAVYTNVDHNAMGWGSLSGVIKFYAFHAGPLLLGILILFLALFIFLSSFRRNIVGEIKKSPALITGLILFLIFFIIAEILPRFPNISLLPDRAWIFVGIFSFVFLYLFLKFYEKISIKIFVIYLLLFIIGIFGAGYINCLKKYLITPAQFQSAQWIKNNLPKNRVFISYGHKGLLPVYANTALIRIPTKLYCENNLKEFESVLQNSDENNPQVYLAFLQNFTQKLNASIDRYYELEKNKNQQALYKDIDLTLSNFQDDIYIAKNSVKESKKHWVLPLDSLGVPQKPVLIEDVYGQEDLPPNIIKDRPLYIYYAKENPKNPYYSRPYEMSTWGIKPCPDGKFLFDLYPDKFQRVYSANNNEVIIWKILE